MSRKASLKRATPISLRRATARELTNYIERRRIVRTRRANSDAPFPLKANLEGKDSDAYAKYASLVFSGEPEFQGEGGLLEASFRGIFLQDRSLVRPQDREKLRKNPAVSEAIDAWDSGESFSDFYSRKLKSFLSEITDKETQCLVRDATDEHVRRTVAHSYSVESYQDALLKRYVSLRELKHLIPGEIHDAEGPYSKLSPELAMGFALMDISDYARNPLGKKGDLFERAGKLPAEFVRKAGEIGKMARKLHGFSPHHAFSRGNSIDSASRLISIYLWACDVYSRIGEDTPYKEGANDVPSAFKGNLYEKKVFDIFCRELSKLPEPRIHNSSEPLEALLSIGETVSGRFLEMRPKRYARLVSKAEKCIERLACENYLMPACPS